MAKKFVDCFMLMGAALSLKSGRNLPESARPLLQDVFTTSVNLSLIITDVQVMFRSNMVLELDFFLNQQWMDARLGADQSTHRKAMAQQIWSPKITNSNGERFDCEKNDDRIFWRGYGNEGAVIYSEKMKIRTFCSNNYREFPFDTQYCTFKFGSFRFLSEEVSIVWKDLNPVQINAKSGNLNGFGIANVSTSLEFDFRLSGNFSVAVVDLVLRRNPKHHLYCIGLPTFGMSLLNYSALWFSLNNRFCRLCINFTTFILLLFYYYISTCLVLPVPYFKALDMYVSGCVVVSLFTLLETLLIDNVCKNEELKYNFKPLAARKKYPKIVFWLEFALKLAYPLCSTFFLLVFGFVFNVGAEFELF